MSFVWLILLLLGDFIAMVLAVYFFASLWSPLEELEERKGVKKPDRPSERSKRG